MSKKLSEDDLKFAYAFLSDRQTYHSRKENMAYLGFLLQIVFTTTVLKTSFPPSWLSDSFPLLLIALITFILWLIIHIFIRWQLRNKRGASLEFATVLAAILKNLGTPQVKVVDEPQKSRLPLGLRLWIDKYLFVVPSADLHYDVGVDKYPEWFQEIFQQQKTGAVYYEYLLTCGSMALLFIMTFKLSGIVVALIVSAILALLSLIVYYDHTHQVDNKS